MNLPEELKYTREHEWVHDNKDGTVTIGITDFAQQELGDIVFIELKQTGSDIDQDDTFGTIEAVKTVSDLFAPISGRIIEINDKLETDPERVNRDPYGDGWLIKMDIRDNHEITQLMSADQYKSIID